MPPSVRKRGRWVPPSVFSVVSLDKAGSWVAEASVVLWGGIRVQGTEGGPWEAARELSGGQGVGRGRHPPGA